MTSVFNLFTSEMKFPFDRFEDFVTCAWKNYYTGRLSISETPCRRHENTRITFGKINIRYNINESLKQFTFSLTYLPTHTYIYIPAFLFMRQRVIMQKFSMAPYTRQNIRGQIYGGPFRNL